MPPTHTPLRGAFVPTAVAVAVALAATSCEVVDPGAVTQANASAAAADPSGLSAALEAADAGAAARDRFEGREIVTYTVADGDTLWEVARDHKVGIADIRVASGLDESETMIRAGQELKIPLPEGVGATSETTTTESSPTSPDAGAGGTGLPPAPTGLPEFDPEAPEQSGSPEPLSPAESGLPAPPPPPPGSGERGE